MDTPATTIAIVAADSPGFARPDLLPERLAAYLREEIVAGRLKPGQRLVEQDLARRCDVSRVPLREALRIVAAEGLVTIAPHRGARVSELSDTELDELFQVRGALEGFAAKIAAGEPSKEAVTSMRGVVDAMRASIACGDLTEYYSLAAQFHDALIAASGNGLLRTLYDQVKTRFRRYQAVMSRLPELPAQSIKEHEKIVRAIQRGDGAGAAEAAERHITSLVGQYRSTRPEKSGDRRPRQSRGRRRS